MDIATEFRGRLLRFMCIPYPLMSSSLMSEARSGLPWTLRNACLNYRQYDPGHIMENIIYNELVKRGYSVDVGVVNEHKKDARIQQEIDFVVNDGDRRFYIQSAYQMDTEQKANSDKLHISSFYLQYK